MGKTGQHVLYRVAGLLMLVLLAGCGESTSTPTVPQTATIFYAHSLAFRNSTTMAWGYNGFGQVGDGSLDKRTAPVHVSGLIGAKGVAIGADHSLAFFNNSTVRAWGYNGFGQLGNGSTTYSSVPVAVKVKIDTSSSINLTGVTAVAAGGFHSLALKNDGTVWAWGENTNGQLGRNVTDTSPLIAGQVMTDPKNGIGLTSITAIAAGGSHSLALDSSGQVWAWGYNKYGQLGQSGDKALVDQNLPQPVTGIKAPVLAIAAGGAFSVAVDNNGTVWAWGYNGFGQLGNNSTTDSNVPKQVVLQDGTFLLNIKAIAAGMDHVLALDGNGAVWAWGYNGLGQLGDDNTTNSSIPVKVQKFTDSSTPVKVDFIASLTATVDGVGQILAVGHHNLARQSDGKLYAWGDNAYGQLGFPPPNNLDTFRTTPQPVNNGM